jgi:hypothetical protein
VSQFEETEYGQFTMKSFNNFYFGPHEAYPYPYADVRSANMAMVRDCSLVFAAAFLLAFAIQHALTRQKLN